VNTVKNRDGGWWRQTRNTTVEAFDGALFGAATASRRLWDALMRRPQNREISDVIGTEIRRPSLWTQRSVWVELAFLTVGEAVGYGWGFDWQACLWLPLGFVAFLLLEGDNTAIEGIVDAYQISVEPERKLKPSGFVRVIKHVASAPVFRLNVALAGVWIMLMIFPHTLIVLR